MVTLLLGCQNRVVNPGQMAGQIFVDQLLDSFDVDGLLHSSHKVGNDLVCNIFTLSKSMWWPEDLTGILSEG